MNMYMLWRKHFFLCQGRLFFDSCANLGCNYMERRRCICLSAVIHC